MIQPITERISNENDTLNEIVNEIAIRSIPKQVYNTYKEYPRFFITTRCVYLVNGTQITRVEVKNWFPSGSSTGGLNVPCKPEEMEIVSEIQNRIQELRDEKSRTYNSIVNTLISLKTSKMSVARGNNVRVRGGMGAILVIAEENEDNYNIASWKAVVVDGVNVKPDTWYKLQNGELVEDNNKN